LRRRALSTRSFSWIEAKVALAAATPYNLGLFEIYIKSETISFPPIHVLSQPADGCERVK
jgi:hypothetical protein